jgi:hypothetical protein
MNPAPLATPARRLAAAALVLAACAEQRPDINRVQPNALDKAFFVGADLRDSSDDPEFWAQASVVDVGYGASQDGLFTSTYAQPMSRIKWVVQEDLLVGRLTYERIADSDGKGAGRTSNDGVVVAAFRIQSHFDIKRDYNPATGEQTNVVSENGFDRPWFERQYMRVDFSRNLNVDSYDFDTLSQIGVYGGVQYESLSYFVNDPNSPDAPHFDVEDGYFDVTNKAFARPQVLDLSHLGWGIDSFPACFLDADFSGGTAPAGSCNPVELTVRHAFRRVVDHDYEPAEWDGDRFKAYGAFTSDRSGYARNYGMADDKWHRLINRYNIWERSHHYTSPTTLEGGTACFTPATTQPGQDPHRDTSPRDGTEDECAAVGRGSRCDTFRQLCTLPYRDRTPVTQVWYYALGSNLDYFEGTEWGAHDWDVALRAAVQVARYAECARTDKSGCADEFPVISGQMDDHEDAVALAREVDDCRRGLAYAGEDCTALATRLAEARGYAPGVIALARMPEMVVLCHSPVEAGDHAACAPPAARLPAGITAAQCAARDRSADVAKACAAAFTVRRGDIRYHQVNVLDAPQTPSPWGIMVDAHDPLTGEKVSASINTWSHVTDLWSQSVVDLARYIKGELKTEDVTEGTYVRDWAAASEASGSGSHEKLTKAQLDERVAAFLNISAERLAELELRGSMPDSNLQARLDALSKSIREIRADASAPSSTRSRYESRRGKARGSVLESELTTKMMQQRAGVSQLGASGDAVAIASPLRGATQTQLAEIQQHRELALADRGSCVMHEAPAPMSVANLADLLEEKFGRFNANDSKAVQHERAEKMRRYIAQKAHYAVTVHEMGHSIGLRHNFVSSSDAWGFRPEYWQLRTDNGATTALCTGAATDPANCVGPRWFDPINENERKNLAWMFMQSSVMDYAGESTQDLLGLGMYDFAAARMFYGESVAVHADPSYRQGSRRSLGMLDKMDGFGGIVGIQPTIGDGSGGTTDIHYSELQNRYQLISNCREVDPQDYKPATWNEARDGAFHPLLDATVVQVGGKYTRCRQQPVDYVSWTELGTSETNKLRAVDPDGRVRMPYGFATDRWADLGNVSVYRHDNGADAYEIFDFMITQQEVMHIFDNYRRARQSFTVRGATDRAFGRYNAKLRDGAKGLGLLLNIYKDFAFENGYDFETLWPTIAKSNFANNILASQMVFDHFSRLIQRPQPGRHYLDADDVLRSEEDAYFNAPGGAAPLVVPNGATGFLGNVSFGGKPLNNALAEDKGEYSAEYTTQAGSYYEKATAAILFTESVDNFISSSRNDFLDARFRAVSLTDMFPDGYRRLLANNLTGDDAIRGPRVAAGADGRPAVDREGFPAAGIGWTSWWHPEGPRVCVPQPNSQLCSTEPARSVVVDPQVGWEQQKFLIAFTLQYLPENQQQEWLNMMGLWEIGVDSDPGFPNRIEFHDPNGRTYVAKTFGTEVLFGKRVQKGIAARVLEYANELMAASYVVTPGPVTNASGQPLWWIPTISADGRPIVKFDPTLRTINANGTVGAPGRPGCNATDNSQCTCLSNRACTKLARYTELPYFIREAYRAYGLAHPSMKGIY